MLVRDLKKKFYDKATHQRIGEHIANKADIITDEDLKNIRTNWNSIQVASNKQIHISKVDTHIQ